MHQFDFLNPQRDYQDVSNPLYAKNEKFPMLDLFSGILGFTMAAERTGRFETLLTSEIDPYCKKLIESKFNLENSGSVTTLAQPQSSHDDFELVEADQVPCEETGFSSVCLEDFYDGAIEFPFIITGGFPCQEVTSANTNALGITGGESQLVDDQLRIIRALEPQYCIFENSSLLVGRGLDSILEELMDIGYIVEWETIAAAAFGYTHYRHRCYVVAYLPTSEAAKRDIKVFDLVRDSVPETPEWKMPLNEQKNAGVILNECVAEQPKAFKLRTKRINALGNSIIPDIAMAIYSAILKIQDGLVKPRKSTYSKFASWDSGWKTASKQTTTKLGHLLLPSSGRMVEGIIYSPENPCRKLNPAKTQYPNLFSTLIKKDGNNNFTCKSRTTRPGKLGGLIGDMMKLGANIGGLHPEFAEEFMGYEKGHSALSPE